MDPQSARIVRDALQDLRKDNRAIMICTHNLTEAEQLADQIAIIRRGRIIAHNSPARLKEQLLGPTQMRITLAQPLDGLPGKIKDLVDVVGKGPDWLEYLATNPKEINPIVLDRLASLAIPVVTLSEIPRSLEAVYLQVVEADDHGEAQDK